MPVVAVEAFRLISSIFMLASCGWNDYRQKWQCTPYCDGISLQRESALLSCNTNEAVSHFGDWCSLEYAHLSESARKIIEKEFALPLGIILLDIHNSYDIQLGDTQRDSTEHIHAFKALVDELDARLHQTGTSRIPMTERKWINNRLKHLVKTLSKLNRKTVGVKSSYALQTEVTCAFYYLEDLIDQEVIQEDVIHVNKLIDIIDHKFD